jgi:hypothetical protein
LIEKAYAKLHGCYEALNGGVIDDGLADLTGLVPERIRIQEQVREKEKSEDLWRLLMSYKSEKTLLGCSINGEAVATGDVRDEDGVSTGLLTNHAYAIIDVLYVRNKSKRKGRNRLLRIRNPWGNREWTGPWSDYSKEIKDNLQEVMVAVDKLGEDE